MRRLRPPGLRVRLVLALLLTSAVTLAVAALTLLPPLERRLQDEEVRALVSTAASTRSSLQDTDLRGPNDTAKRAFLSAALVGFATAMLIGIGLATTLLRRLRRLRDAALRLGARGLSAEAPRDRGRDEIGDLSRAFGSMQTQLRAQEEARKRFVATASHELRTPLASLHGVLELADDDLASEPADVADAREQVGRARD